VTKSIENHPALKGPAHYTQRGTQKWQTNAPRAYEPMFRELARRHGGADGRTGVGVRIALAMVAAEHGAELGLEPEVIEAAKLDIAQAALPGVDTAKAKAPRSKVAKMVKARKDKRTARRAKGGKS
jgi:hypothetical protein